MKNIPYLPGAVFIWKVIVVFFWVYDPLLCFDTVINRYAALTNGTLCTSVASQTIKWSLTRGFSALLYTFIFQNCLYDNFAGTTIIWNPRGIQNCIFLHILDEDPFTTSHYYNRVKLVLLLVIVKCEMSDWTSRIMSKIVFISTASNRRLGAKGSYLPL